MPVFVSYLRAAVRHLHAMVVVVVVVLRLTHVQNIDSVVTGQARKKNWSGRTWYQYIVFLLFNSNGE